ncbi:uncharacterized protein LOC130728568 isoform X2 [Lotus japonicus]|uniref:uncharacterized protein LOC130728568 isoform X2 n=1 Tax=Lotus japonicus TaxID=34305 RepID=UPI00258E5DDD|nr:uncharacterized protein LOC130728568 isoform X2 [Lotus japonicus]
MVAETLPHQNKDNDDAKDNTDPKQGDSDSEDEEENDDELKKKGTSNKKKKRMKIAELKHICSRPYVVEAWDATASDPKLLVFLKSYRNTVPVPRHWSQKRKFLQGERGVEKQPFQLPDFIAATGIEKIRQAYIEKEDGKRLKQKQREHLQPKMGKMDIDYQILHDAFFKYQTKPKLTSLGELYHEGKEFEVKLREMKPDMLSHELKEAPGMPEGAPSNYEEEPVFNTKHWGDLEEKDEEEELEAGTYVFNLSRYEKPRPEEKLRSQRFSDTVAENEKKRKRTMQEKEVGKWRKKDFF